MVTVMADTIMVGRVGTVPLAAATLAGSVWIVGFLFVLGFTIAITPRAGAAWGRRSMPEFVAEVRAGTWVAVSVALFVVVLLLAIAPYLDMFGAPKFVSDAAGEYYVWIVLSTLPRIGFGVFKQTAEAMSNTRSAMIIAVVANAANVLLNWVLIYGNLGVPALGLEGAGIATFASRVLMLGLAFMAFRKARFFLRLRSALRNGHQRPSAKMLLASFLTGLPIAGQIILEVLAFAAGAIMMGWLGAVPLAAHQIALNLASLSFMVVLGIGNAATIVVSNAFGQGDTDGVRNAGRAALRLVAAYTAITAAAMFALRFLLPELYSTDSEVIALASTLLLFAAVFQVFDGAQNVGIALLRGANDVNIPTVMAVVSYLGVCIPLSYVAAFVFGMGAPGIWLGYVGGLAVAAAQYFLRFRHLTKLIQP